MEPGQIGVAEQRVHRIVQVVADNAGKPFTELRVLDLAAHECGFAIEFARHGADVVAIEARDAHIAKARFVKECLGLDNLEIVQGDVRTLSRDQYGMFDVVLCLGILYHLDTQDIVPFLTAIQDVSLHLLILETQMSLKAREKFEGPVGSYWGKYFSENIYQLGAAIDSQRALWLTKASLLNLLRDVGFTSASQILNPPISIVDAFIDHGAFLVIKGEQQQVLSSPEAARRVSETYRWPEHIKPITEPRQRLSSQIKTRVLQVFGRSIYDKVFRKTDSSR
jgi:hypothetical protein